MSIRAVHSAATRAETHEAFNDAGTCGTVLVTNLRLWATSMNLQKGYADLVFLEVPESANTAAQGIGRVHRIGQTRVQNIWIVTVNHTWDQRQQARAALKMYGQIAGQTDIQLDDGEVLALAATIGGKGEGGESEPLTAEARVRMAGDRIRHEEVIKLYMEMFSQRSRRDLWTSERDLTEKDFLDTEVGRQMEKDLNPKVTMLFRRMAKRLIGDNDTTAPQKPIPIRLASKKRVAGTVRAETYREFNKSSTKGTVLMTNLRLGATSMNLQHGCSDLVFLEVPESANTAAQGIGRVHRIGQTNIQNIYIATCNYSWDQRQQARAALKSFYG